MCKSNSILVLVAILFTSTLAFASEPTKVWSDELVAQAKKECLTQEYPGSDEAKLMSRLQCLTGIDMQVLKQKQAAGDKKVEAALAQITAKSELLDQMIAAQAEAAQAKVEADKLAEEKAKKAALLARRNMQVGGPMMPVAPYAIIDAPGRYLAATWEMPEMMASRIKIEALELTLRGIFYLENAQVRIVVMKNGQPLAIAHPGAPNGAPRFNEFYADIDGDNKPEPTAYKGADVTFTNQVYVSYVPGDQVQIYFLVPSGKMLAIPGMPPQTMWKTLGAFSLQPPQAIQRKWDMTPYNGVKIR